jgi:hypothetical protein
MEGVEREKGVIPIVKNKYTFERVKAPGIDALKCVFIFYDWYKKPPCQMPDSSGYFCIFHRSHLLKNF